MITESLHSEDLKDLVKKVFEIDSYKSKVGNDEDICVLSFTVDQKDPAKDLENFFEMGYSFILDSDCTSGETDDGKYIVFVEIERSRHLGRQIFEIVEGVKKLTGLEDMRFRYFKNFKSQSATEAAINAVVPNSRDEYNIATKEQPLNNFSNFFSNSYSDSLNVVDESITFKRAFSGPVTFEILNSGTRQEVYAAVQGPIMLESKDMAEVMFLSKVIGNYNITKIKDTFIFENSGWAVALKRK